ncbi:Transcription factor tau subunit sfc6 (TFIIIC subunit sfc6) (Transcription factor C subunit 6), partial [Durusdinium trenchii]
AFKGKPGLAYHLEKKVCLKKKKRAGGGDGAEAGSDNSNKANDNDKSESLSTAAPGAKVDVVQGSVSTSSSSSSLPDDAGKSKAAAVDNGAASSSFKVPKEVSDKLKSGPVPCPLCGKEQRNVPGYKYHVGLRVCERQKKRKLAKEAQEEAKKAAKRAHELRRQAQVAAKAALQAQVAAKAALEGVETTTRVVDDPAQSETTTATESPTTPAMPPASSPSPRRGMSAKSSVGRSLMNAKLQSTEYSVFTMVPEATSGEQELLDDLKSNLRVDSSRGSMGSEAPQVWCARTGAKEVTMCMFPTTGLAGGNAGPKLDMNGPIFTAMRNYTFSESVARKLDTQVKVPGLQAATNPKSEDASDVFVNAGLPVTTLDFAPGTDLLALGTLTAAHEIDMHGISRKEKEFKANQLQLWRIENRGKTSLQYLVKIVFSGPVRVVRWLPSGRAATTEGPRTSQRVGLLAVATASGKVRVLNMPVGNARASTEPIPVYESAALTVFAHDFADGIAAAALHWSVPSPHRFLFAGLSDGSVAAWDFFADWTAPSESVSESESESGKHRLPCTRLVPALADQALDETHKISHLAASTAVCGISCCPDSEHVLATVDASSRCSVWDLRKPSAPILEARLGEQPVSVCWPPNADFLVLGGANGAVTMHHFAGSSGKDAVSLPYHSSAVHAMRVHAGVWSPILLATGGSDGLLCTFAINPRSVTKDGNLVPALQRDLAKNLACELTSAVRAAKLPQRIQRFVRQRLGASCRRHRRHCLG